MGTGRPADSLDPGAPPGQLKSMKTALHVILALTAICCGCGGRAPEGAREGLVVVTSLAPHADLVKRLAGELADVSYLVPPGADPHTYEPLPSDMQRISSCDLYLTAGLPFEDAWLPRITGSSPGLRTVSLLDGIQLLQEEDGDGHADPHTWLSPGLMAIQAGNAARALQALDPADSIAISMRLDTVLAGIADLQEELHSELDSLRGSSILVVHPSYGYFAREFGLIQIAMEEGGSEATPSELADLVRQAGASGARFVVASPQFGTRTAEAVSSELGIPLVFHDPLAEDWMQGLRQLGAELAGGAVR